MEQAVGTQVAALGMGESLIAQYSLAWSDERMRDVLPVLFLLRYLPTLYYIHRIND